MLLVSVTNRQNRLQGKKHYYSKDSHYIITEMAIYQEIMQASNIASKYIKQRLLELQKEVRDFNSLSLFLSVIDILNTKN